MKLSTLPLWAKVIVFVTSPVWGSAFALGLTIVLLSQEVWSTLFDDGTPKYN